MSQSHWIGNFWLAVSRTRDNNVNVTVRRQQQRLFLWLKARYLLHHSVLSTNPHAE